MNERTCGNCRWWKQEHSVLTYGYCHRYAPTQGPLCWVRPQAEADATCGEWADGSITPEQEERRELVRRFAVAIAPSVVSDNSINPSDRFNAAWTLAEAIVQAEPGNSGREI